MTPADHVEPKKGQPGEIEILKGKAIWIETVEDCDILRKITVLPNAWSLLSQLGQGTLTKSDLAYLHNVRFKLLSTVDDHWNSFMHETNTSNALKGDDSLAKVDKDSGLIHLLAALRMLHEIWSTDNNRDVLRALLTIPETIGGDVEISTDGAAFIIRPGSLDVLIGWKAAYYASQWIIGLCVRRGRVPSQIADDVVKELRAQAKSSGKLPTLRDVQPDEVHGKCGIIFFIHGLMSIDVGLFDEFITLLNSDEIFKNRYLMVGFPHDSFAAITTNATTLVEEIEYLLENNTETLVAFVCHSRGGLLARQVALELYRAKPDRWKRQLAGCVTYGTPHRGTPLAEYPEKLLGAGVAAIRALQPGGFMGVSDVLALVAAYRGAIPGIQDLIPTTAIGRGDNGIPFLSSLGQAERYVAGHHECRLPILAIGGAALHDSLLAGMTNKIFRGKPHDCAVELSSSAPERMVRVKHHEVRSDHFSYFKGREGFPEAIQFLKEQMNYAECSEMPAWNPMALQHDMPVPKPINLKKKSKA